MTMASPAQQKGPQREPAPTDRGPARATIPPRRTWVWFVVVLLLNFLVARMLWPGPEGPVTVPYTLFKEEVAKRNVQAVHSQGETITGRFKTLVTYQPSDQKSTAPKGGTQTTGER